MSETIKKFLYTLPVWARKVIYLLGFCLVFFSIGLMSDSAKGLGVQIAALVVGAFIVWQMTSIAVGEMNQYDSEDEAKRKG